MRGTLILAAGIPVYAFWRSRAARRGSAADVAAL
jgi:hypothetical protein